MTDCYKELSMVVFTHFDQYNDENNERKKSGYYVKNGEKNELYNEFSRYIYSDFYKKYKDNDFSEEEKEKLEREELIKEKEILINKSKELYYAIDTKKCKELQEYIESQNAKNSLNSPKPFVSLGNGLCYKKFEEKYIIYDENTNKNLGEIKIQEKNSYNNELIGLDNKDILFAGNKTIYIYRLKNGNLFLFQKIKINSDDLIQQKITIYHGCTRSETKELYYKYNKTEAISQNRFFMIFNYGIKLFGIDKKNEYSLISTYHFTNDLLSFHEIDENTFIFCYNIDIGMGMLGPAHSNYLIEKIVLFGERFKSKKLYNFNTYGETYKENYTINGKIIFKNRYFIVLIDYYILIIDTRRNISKKYLICENGKKNLYQYYCSISKKNKSDEEFIIFNKKEYTLFKFIEEELDIKIIGYYYKK